MNASPLTGAQKTKLRGLGQTSPDNLLVAAAGNFEHERLVELALGIPRGHCGRILLPELLRRAVNVSASSLPSGAPRLAKLPPPICCEHVAELTSPLYFPSQVSCGGIVA